MNGARRLRQAWQEGRTTFGLWAALPSAFATELMCEPGIDYLCADQQHGIVDYADMVGMLRAAESRNVTPVTRVPANETWLISKALDAGAQGVVVPLVNNRAEAAAAVAACRYPPKGVRSYGPIRSSLVMAARDLATLGDDMICMAMVETRAALDAIDEIAGTPGLDGIYVGPADLALGLGLPPDLDKQEPEHVAAVQKILDACKRHGIVAGIQCGNGRSGRAYAERGFQFVTIAKDSSLLQAAVQREVAAARAEGSEAATRATGYT